MKKGIWITPEQFVSFAEGGRGKSSLRETFASRHRTWDVEGALSCYLPDPDKILRSQGNDVRVYRDLLTDAHVGSVVDSRKAGVPTQGWTIERGKANRRRYELVKSIFESLDVHRVITDILEAPLFGFSPMEILWERRDGLIVPGDFVGKPPEWFRFSQENELLFISKSDTNGEPVPELKFITAQNDPSYQNPYGKRILSRCFWPVTFKRGGYKFWAMFLEKYGMPLLVGTYPRGTDDDKVDEMLSMLANMIQDAVAVIPEGAQVDAVTAPSGGGGGGGRGYREFLEFGNKEISKAVLGQTLTTEMQSSGSYAASQTHFAVRGEIVDSDKRIVEWVMNELISHVYEINFGMDEEKPVFQLYEQKDVQKDRAERDKTLSEIGVKFTKKYFEVEYDLDEKDFELEDPKPAPAPAGGEGEGEFSESPSQRTLDSLETAIGDMDAELQAQAEATLEVVFSLAEKTRSFEEFSEKLAEIYPELDTDSLAKSVEKAAFLGKVWGGMNAGD